MAEPDTEVFARWKAELDHAQKDKKYTAWLDRSEKIVQRYRDDRKGTTELAKRRMNILWSNVETLRPAVYAKMPKPIVERRFMDRDKAARLASTILERCLSFQMEINGYHHATSQAVLDYLLPGMGQVWVRYEPVFEAATEGYENKEIERKEKTAEQIEENGDGEPYEKLAYEKVCVDYVYFRDFLWGVARTWQEVPWVAKRSYLTRSQIAERFFDGNLKEAQKVNLDYVPERQSDSQRSQDETASSYFKKAEVWEIWNKADQTVYFIAPGTPDLVLKKEPKPILKLEGFWPCPRPLFTTQTHDTLVPVPDYVEYQDQAAELDDLTGRIAALTTALRVNGVYDASEPALARLLQDGQDNRLIPVDNWAAFAEKGGAEGAISLIPIKEIADVLIGLYNARSQVKNDLFEVTGMSDIVRGQGTGTKTATEQRIKGQFASMRLEDRRAEVARFCRDTVQIVAEVISEMFSDDVLLEMSGVGLMIEDEVRDAMEDVPPPPPPPKQGPDGQPVPPEVAQQQQQMAMMAFEQAKQQAGEKVRQEKIAEFQKALQILRSDKLRGFRVDIETDTTIGADAEAEKSSAVELLTGTVTALVESGQVVMAVPELAKPIGSLILNAYRKARVGRTIEASLEDALDQIERRMAAQKDQPKPPSPEEVKVKGDIEKQKMEMQRAQMEAQLEMQARQQEMELQREKNAMEIQKMQMELQIERERLNLEREKLGLEAMAAQQDAAIKAEGQQMEMEAQREQHELDRDAADHKHQLGKEALEAKTQAQKEQAKAKPKEKAA